MRTIVLLILSILYLNLWSQENKFDYREIEMFRKAIATSSSLQANNRGFIRFSQYGNNNKANINTKGTNIDIDAVQIGASNNIDFDIRGNNTYNNIFQSGEGHTFKGKFSLSNRDFNLIQSGKENYLEIRRKNIIPMIIKQRGKGIKMIIY